MAASTLSVSSGSWYLCGVEVALSSPGLPGACDNVEQRWQDVWHVRPLVRHAGQVLRAKREQLPETAEDETAATVRNRG